MKKTSQKISKTKENKLGFFHIKPISSFLCSDEQFKFVIELGKRIKYLVPVDPKTVVEADNAKVEYLDRL